MTYYHEVIERKRAKKPVGKYGIKFLDDRLAGIKEEDFVLIGSEPGAGKTELAYHIAYTNAEKIKVHLFALEADQDEVANRQLYKLIAQKYYEECRQRINKRHISMNYRNYITNSTDMKEYEDYAADKLESLNLSLFVHERSKASTITDFIQVIKEAQHNCDLIILDHLDYLDIDEGESENQQMTEIMKQLRTVNLVYKKPIIAISHMRKKQSKKVLIPDQEDFFGSSNKIKQAKTVILLSPDYDTTDYKENRYGTYCRVAKCRIGGPRNIVGRLIFDGRLNLYDKDYLLAKVDRYGESIENIEPADYPDWACEKPEDFLPAEDNMEIDLEEEPFSYRRN